MNVITIDVISNEKNSHVNVVSNESLK